MKRKPFYAQSLDDTINIEFEIRPYRQWLAGDLSAIQAYEGLKIKESVAYMIETQYTRSSLNLKSFMAQNSQTILHYPFQMPIPMRVQKDLVLVPNQTTSIQMGNWLNADITGLVLQFIQTKYDTGAQGALLVPPPVGGTDANPLLSEQVGELTLSWNNIIIYHTASGKHAQLYNMFDSYGSASWTGADKLEYTTTPSSQARVMKVADKTANVGSEFLYMIPFSNDGMNFKGVLKNTIRAGSSNPFQLDIRPISGKTANETFNLYITVQYQADLAVNQAKSFVQVS